jgi:hypothetical protein
MSPWRLFGLALALPVLFTVLVLVHVQRNRAGGREAMELTQREVSISPGSDENSGVTAYLGWSEAEPGRQWLSADRLRSIGFDLSIDPASTSSARTFARRLPRRAYVVLELRETRPPQSRLVPVDASINREELMATYPNGRTHLITTGLVGIRRGVGPAGQYEDGYVASIDPRGIHVSAEFAARVRKTSAQGMSLLTVRYGSRLEPWIVDVR